MNGLTQQERDRLIAEEAERIRLAQDRLDTDLGNYFRTTRGYASGGASLLRKLKCGIRRGAQGAQPMGGNDEMQWPVSAVEAQQGCSRFSVGLDVDTFDSLKLCIRNAMIFHGAAADAIAELDAVDWREDEVSPCDCYFCAVDVRRDDNVVAVYDGHFKCVSSGKFNDIVACGADNA